MKVKYFSDTDTALMEFTDKEAYETKEIGENGVGEWIKYVLYNRHTERFILRSCVKYTAPDENSMLIASKSFGKCLPSHDPNWLVNETNLASDKEFWKQLKLNLAI